MGIAGVTYGMEIIGEIYRNVNSFHSLDREAMELFILNLIDMGMLMGLLIMTIIGGYSVFVKEIKHNGSDNPQFLHNLSGGFLKVKLSTTLIGITSILILRRMVEMSSANFDTTKFELLLVAHCVLLVSSYILAATDRKMHQND